MGSELYFENKKYIPVRDASALTGYSKDYIGQLCRANKIDARRIGKIWYVSEVSILSYEPSVKENLLVENIPSVIVENISVNSESEISNLQSKYSVSRIGEIFASRRNKDISDENNSNVFADSAVKTSSLVSVPTPFKFSSNFRPVSVLMAIVFIFGLISIGGQLKNVSPRTLTSAVVNAVSKTINPVDHSGLVVYENVNGWVERNIYSPISNLFGKKGNTIIYVAQTNTTKNNISTTTKVSAKKTVAVTPVVTKVVNNTNVIERIIEKNTVTSGISSEDFEARLQELNNNIMSKFFSLSTGSGGNVTNIYQQIAHSQRIDQLTNTVINNPTINGGSITNTSISAGSISANSASLGTTTLTNLTVSNTSTSTYAGGIAVSGGCVSVNGVCLGTGNGGYSIIEDEGGALTARTTINFVGGGVVASDSGSVTTVTINGTSFTGAANSIIATDASGALVATGTQLTVGNLISTTTASSYFSGNLGVGTTSPYAPLSVVGQIVGSYFTATTSATSTFAGGVQANLLNVTSTTATSSFANGINITGGCFAINGTCFSGTGASPLTFTYPLQESSNIVSLAFGTTTANTWGALQTFEFSSTTYASFNTASTTNLIFGGSTFTSLLGTGLSNVGGILTIDSTTQNNAINSYIAASTTIPKTYTSNTFTALQTFANATATLLSSAYSSSTFATVGTLTLPNLTSGFLGVGANGSTYSFATSTIRTSQLTNDANFSTFPFTVNTGYNGTSTIIGFNGLFSTASSTFGSSLFLPSLTQGFAFTGSNGLVQTIASSSIRLSWFNNDAGFITSLAGAASSTLLSDANTFSGANTFNALSTFSNSSTTLGSFAYSSSTLSSIGTLTLPSLTSGFLGVGANGSTYSFATSTIRTSQLTNDANFSTFPFTVNTGYNSTSTIIGFNGLFSTASSTFGSSLYLPSLTTGALAVNGSGLVYSFSTSTWTFASSTLLSDFNTFSNTNNFTGRVGFASSTPWAQLSINPNAIGAATPAFAIGSTTATAFSILANGNAGSVFNYGTISTTTIKDSTVFSWTIATSTTATPIFRIDTSTGKKATTTITGGLDIDAGAFSYDYSSGITSIDNLNLGSLNFDTDAGIVSWIDMPVATTTANIINSYTAQMDGNPLLTLFGLSDGLGGVKNLGVAIGTTTASNLAVLTVASSTQPQLSLSAGAGLAQWTFRNAGGNLYLSTTTAQGLSTSSIPAFSINGTTGTTTLWAFNAIATGTNATSTIEGNLNVKGTLKIGAASVYISETGIYSDTGSAFNLGNNGQDITIGSSALIVSATGFGTTTLSGLSVNGSATSTSNVGFNLTNGCFAINGTCLSTSASSADFPFTVNTGYNSTSTTIGFTNGLFSTASSTFSSSLFLPSLTQGALYTGTNGLAQTVATSSLSIGSSLSLSGTLGALLGGTNSTISLNTGNANTWTALQSFNYSSSTIYSSFQTSSTTVANIGTLTLPSLTSGGLAVNGSGVVYSFSTSTWTFASSTLLSNFNTFSNTNVFSSLLGVGTSSLPATLTVNGLAGLSATYQPVDAHQIWVGPQSLNDIGFYLNSSDYNSLNVFTADAASTTQSLTSLLGWLRVGTTTPFGAGVTGYVSVDHPSGTVDEVTGIEGQIHIDSAGDISNANGVFSYTRKNGNGVLSNLYNFNSDAPFYGAGGITNLYGYYASDLSGSASSTYAFYSNSASGASDYAFYGAGTAKSYFGGNVGIGTTTSNFNLTISSSTASQLALSAGAGLAQWAFRNAGGNFYLSTTTVAGTATSTLAALSINGTTGALALGTTTAGTLKINSSGLVYSDTSSASSGYATIADEGSSLTQRSILNFIGNSVTCIDNSGSTRTDCTFTSSGGSGGGSWSTTTSSVSGTLVNYSNNNSDVIAIGGNSTTSAEFWFDPNVLMSYFSGKMSIASSTPWGMLSINPNGIGSGVPEFVIGSTTETHFIVDGRGYVGIGTTSPYAHLSVVADDNLVNPAYFEGNVNSYFQLNLKNRSNGSSASSDYVATADIGTETTYYLDLGINNSKYTQSTYSSQNALDGFLINSDGGLVIGTASSTNTNADIRFVTGGLASSSIRATITETGLFGLGTTSPWALLSASSTSVSPLAVFDQRGTGGLLTLQSSGIDRFVVGNNGGLSIFTDTSDIVRTKTGTQGANDFSRTGSTLTNVVSSNDELSISDGTISGEGTIAATTTVTNVITGSGSQVIIRADGKYVIIHGNSSATASLWNGRTNGTISALGVNVVSTGSVGAGAIALKRANGRYQMIHGGGSAGLTSIFDPMGVAPTVAGAATCGAAAIATGTNAFLRPDGNYLVMCGGQTASSMFNPVSGSWTVGPTLSTGTYGAGSIALARDDGTFLIMPGNNTANTFAYSPYNTTTNIGTMTQVTISGAPTIGTSTVAIRRQDGKYLIIPGTAGASFLYDPVRTQTNPEGTFTSLGVGPSTNMGEGAQAIWRQDGKYLLLLGGTTVTNVVDPGAGSILPTFTSSGAPTLSATPGFGQTAFMLPDGRYAITLGGGTNTINTYDMNFVRGGDYNANTGGTGSEVSTYETECIVNGNINPSSTLNWNANSEGAIYFQVKMGSGGTCSGSYQNVIRSGDLIGAASTTNAVQVKVFFKRDLPVFLDQEWGVRKGYLTRYRRVNKDPSLYDFSIDNGNLLHRTQFDFGSIVSTTTSADQANLASGPVSINISNNSDRNLGMSLIQGVGLAAGFNTTMSGLYNGAFASTSALTTGTATSTIVLKRPDGKFVILVGTTTASAMVYDQVDGSITANTTSPAQAIGLGAQAFKRPDGKFFIVYGNGSNGTSIYDPIANTFSVGTSTVGNVGEGSMVITLPTGKVLIIHGNASQTTSIYDPVQNTMIAGPATTAVVGPGAMAIPNADGTYMVAPGSATLTCTAISVTATMQFDPYTMMFTAAGADGFTTNGPGRGAVAIQRKDGTWLIAKGAGGVGCYTATNITEVYNPVTKRFQGTGATLATAIGPGAMAIPRPDGNWLIFNGLAAGARTNTTNIYMPGDATAVSGGTEGQGAAVAGPVGPLTGVGAVSFQRDDGKFVIIGGAATSTSATDIALYDAGWVTQGYYRSEQIDMTGELDSNVSLVWKSNNTRGISAEVRTASTQAALSTSTHREIPTSGGLIGAQSTDNWVSIMFNFKRNLPQNTGIFEDVNVSNLSGRYRVPYYTIDNPTLYEFKLTKDKDLLNLQADGLSMFRVNSSGDIFASVGATINTSGADLAERYTSQETLDFGDVVTIDPMNNHAVKKSKYQYQTDMVGVVSTDPGFVSGAYTENSYPIGLIGRVPVKVSTENGIIRVGDYLTTSSVPGHAMKATLSGRVLGKALESMDESKLVDCPASDVYVPGRKCTTIMMFVNLIDYGGQSVDSAMSDWKTLKTAKLAQAALDSGLEFATTTSVGTSTVLVPSMTSHDAEVLNFLSDLKAERAIGVASMSEILTDKVSAISQIISPEIISRIVKSEVIDGLEVRSEKVNTKALTTDTISGNGMTMSLVDGKLVIRGTKVISTTISTTTNAVATSTLSSELANALSALELSSTTELFATSTDITASTTNTIASTTEPLASTTPVTVVENEVVVSFDTSGNAYFAGEVVANKVSTGALAVTGVATFSGGLEVTSIGSASTTIAMMSDTEFFGRPYFTSDTGGTAVVKKDAKEVEVVFDREYVEAPILSASMAYSTSTDEAEIDAMFTDDIRFVVTKRDTKGFTIRLNKPASRDIVFNWIALAIKDSKEFTSRTVVPNDLNNTATTTPSMVVGTSTTTPVTGGTSISTTTSVTTTVGTTTSVVDPSVGTTTPVVIDPNSTNSNPVPTPTTVEVLPVVETTPTPAVDTTVVPPVEIPAEVVVPDPAPTVTP